MDSYRLRRELPNTKVNARKMLEKLSQTLVMSTCTQSGEAAQASQILAQQQQQAEAFPLLKSGRLSAGESGQHFMQRSAVPLLRQAGKIRGRRVLGLC